MNWKTLAELSGIPIRTIFKAAKGHDPIGINAVRKLARGLGIPTSALVREVEHWTPKPFVQNNRFAVGAYKRPVRMAITQTIAPRSFETYQPPRWIVRAGGEAHKQIKSLYL